MGLLIPPDLPFDGMTPSERQVVRAFQSTLSDSWLIIPRLDLINEQRPFEVDVLLINDLQGVVGIEVKGGPFTIRQGEWYRPGGRIQSPPPPRQAQAAAYELRDQLRRKHPTLLEKIHVQPAVALPDLVKPDGLADQLPPGVTDAQLLFSEDFQDLNVEMEDRLWKVVATNVKNGPLAADQVEAIVGFVRPDLNFQWDPQAHARYAQAALRRISTELTRALATLDANRTVVVDGRAGTGKTHLALEWAKRAVQRGERTLLTCYNDPIAECLKESLSDSMEDGLLTVGPFERILMELPGLPPLEEPADADEKWWATKPFEHLKKHCAEVTDLFDTVIIDEGQDFSDEWRKVARSLLRDGDTGRMLRLVDPVQDIYERGYQLPLPGSDLVRASLTVNCRNSRSVATFVRRFGGALPSPAAPEGEPVEFLECSSAGEAVSAVGTMLEEFVVDSHIEPANILVCTGHSDRQAQRDLRDLIRAESPGGYSCAAWETWVVQDGEVVCETVHRSKGLERYAVILVTEDENLDDDLLYVGMSRAIMRLVVIGPPNLIKRLRNLSRWAPGTDPREAGG